MVKAVVIAGTHSGVGKTSLSVGLMLALRQKGLVVQPFKVGPDFLDPLHHAVACSRASVNLDGWMLNQQQVMETFHRHTVDADVAVIEGVMGLFDSRDGASDDGSTAQIAKWLGAPVVLVVDCWAMARSAAALVKGYAEFDHELKLCGVLLNKVGGTAHGLWLKEALGAAWQQQRLKQPVTVLGCIPKNDAISIPERHLGLTRPHEQQEAPEQHQLSSHKPSTHTAGQDQHKQVEAAATAAAVPPYLARLALHISTHVDLEQLMELAASIAPPDAAASILQQSSTCATLMEQQGLQELGSRPPALPLLNAPVTYKRCRIAVARDEAFCFYYQDNLSLLAAAGAELVFFSPLRDQHLPGGITGIYLGGGYPECHAHELSSNTSLLSEVRDWASAGGVLYAECGGLMYLCQGLEPSTSDSTGAKANSSSTISSNNNGSTTNSSSCRPSLVPLAGVLPFTAHMGRMSMGYVEVEVLSHNPLFPPGVRVRGQVYHFSHLKDDDSDSPTTSSSWSSSSSSNGSSLSHTSSRACGTPPCAARPDGQVAVVQRTYQLQQLRPGASASLEGYSVGNVLASYVHLHWGGCPQLAMALVDKCCSSNCNSSSSQGPVGNSAELLAPAAHAVGSAAAATTAAAAAADTPISAMTAPAEHCSQGGKNNCCICSSSSSNSSSSATARDNHSHGRHGDKIVSLLPSGTEIVFALGLQDRLVGVSGFCDWPPEARDKPCAVRSLIDVEALSSDEVEAAMQSFKAAGQSPFEVDVELLAQQQPALVLTQDACGTCDADCSVVCKALQEAGLGPHTTQVLVLHPNTLAEVMDSIVSIGTAAGVADRATHLVSELKDRLAAVAAAVHLSCPAAASTTVAKATVCGYRPADVPTDSVRPGLSEQAAADAAVPTGTQVPVSRQHAPRVLSLEGLNPLVLGGQWLPDVKLAAGAVDASGQRPGDPPTRITWQQVVDFAPEVLLLCPCSRSTAAAMPDVTRLTQLAVFKDLPAVASGRVYVIDHSYFSRPGPRLVEVVELLHSLLWGRQPPAEVQPHVQQNDQLPLAKQQHQHDYSPQQSVYSSSSSSSSSQSGAAAAVHVSSGRALPADCGVPAVPQSAVAAEQAPSDCCSTGSAAPGHNSHVCSNGGVAPVLKIKILPGGDICWLPWVSALI